jgi:hypothetical protein
MPGRTFKGSEKERLSWRPHPTRKFSAEILPVSLPTTQHSRPFGQRDGDECIGASIIRRCGTVALEGLEPLHSSHRLAYFSFRANVEFTGRRTDKKKSVRPMSGQ